MAALFEYALDTETTGLSPAQGHRVIEIACIELKDRERTGRFFHYYLNPGRDIDKAASKVHGITLGFLKDKPKFIDVFAEFLEFIQSGDLVIHNAPFDIGFLNAEFAKVGKKSWRQNKSKVVDTLEIARKKYPGQRNNLDALCRRLGVDNSGRELHGALLDTELLIDVYLTMTSEQSRFALGEKSKSAQSATQLDVSKIENQKIDKIPVINASDEELELHDEFMDSLSTV